MTNEMVLSRIDHVLQEMRPNIQMDGGDIEYVSFRNGVVSLRLHGACASCPLSMYTLKLGIEERLKESVPEVVEVVAVE
jgi:Fe-S cluster biogenesis protein NfuA